MTTRKWKFCPQCSHKLNESWKFCAECGEQLHLSPTTTTVVNQPPVIIIGQPQYHQYPLVPPLTPPTFIPTWPQVYCGDPLPGQQTTTMSLGMATCSTTS